VENVRAELEGWELLSWAIRYAYGKIMVITRRK